MDQRTGSDAGRFEFDGELVRFGPSRRWTGVKVPFHVPAVWGTRTRVAVRGTFCGCDLRGWVVPSGNGGFFLLVGRELRRAAGVEAGGMARVVFERVPAGPAVPDAGSGRPS